MLHSDRNVARNGHRFCPCGCVSTVPNRTLRTREKAALARALRRGEV